MNEGDRSEIEGRLDGHDKQLADLREEDRKLWRALNGDQRPTSNLTSAVALMAALGVLFGPAIAVLAGKLP